MSTQRGNKNSDAIRILQRDRDASARATHLKAEIGMVPNSTIERKIMSTKTSIKRIALVAAAALTLGGFSAVSASAADNTYMFAYTADGLATGTIANTTANGVAGPANYVTLAFTNGAVGIATITGGTFGTGSGAVTVNTGSTSAVIATAATGRLTVLTPTVGTITVNYYNNVSAGVYSSTVTESVVITVKAAASAGVYSASNSSVYIGAGETFTTLAADVTTPISKVKTYVATDSATATILVNYLDGTGTSGAAITEAAKDSLTATITSGPGTLYVPTIAGGATTGYVFDSRVASWSVASGFKASDSVGKFSVSALPDNTGRVAFMVFANGAAGVTTVTIKNAAGTVVGTKTLTFTGTDVSSIALTVVKSNVNADKGSATSAVISAVLKDSAGNAVVGTTWAPTVTYDVSTKGTLLIEADNGADTRTSDATGKVTYGWTPVAAAYGPVTVTVTDPTTKATASATITLSSPIAKTVTITAPASADLGTPFSFTVTAKDANGYGIPDALTAAAIVASASHYAGVTTTDLSGTFAGGVATIKATGPSVSATTGKSTFTLVGTAGTAATNLVSTLTGTDVVVSYTISGTDSSSLAYDAASAATDAANNAYEEAQNATQAASDALAAVKALAVQVKALIALVNKIKAKLKA